MVKVPEYNPGVALRPIHQSGVDVRATPDHFGAAIGRGMGQAAQGLDSLAGSLRAVSELEDQAEAKEREKKFLDWKRERMYGDGGFMTLEGRNAVDQRKTFEDDVEAKRRELGNGLRPGAAKVYQQVTDAHLQNTFQQSIVHTAGARKTWFKEASSARLQMFADEALVNYNNPDALKKNMLAGLIELREKGQLEGWDADTLKMRELEYASGVHKNVALRMLQDGPNSALAADKYVKENAAQMTGSDQYDLRKTLETEVKNAQSIQGAADFFTKTRGSIKTDGSNSADGQRTIGRAGPTNARAFLLKKSNKDASHVDGLDETFATNLAALMQDAPPEIREGLGVYSGYRSPERQAELYQNALKKYGSPQAARRWVAPPGRSNHNHGKAVDLSYNGRSLQHAPENVKRWVHENAKKYGMYFPMAHEPWHIEPLGTRGSAAPTSPPAGPDQGATVAARGNTVSYRASMPSYDEIEAHLEGIADPEVRDLTRKRIFAQMEAQNKAIEQQEKAAKAELWRYIDQGATPDDVPFEVRQAAGMAAVSSAWGYIDTAAKGRATESDETLLYDMQRYAAMNPTEFASIDLNDYRDRLSKEDIRKLSESQTSALKDERKAREDGVNLTTAFSQASTMLESVGLTTTGKEGAKREEAAKRIARFQNALAQELEAFKQENGKAPNQMEIQSMINRMLLPVVMKQERSIWDPFKTPWSAQRETNGFLFEAPYRPDGSAVDVRVEYEDIPADMRRVIEGDLKAELGRKPSPEEIIQRYEEYLLNQ